MAQDSPCWWRGLWGSGRLLLGQGLPCEGSRENSPVAEPAGQWRELRRSAVSLGERLRDCDADIQAGQEAVGKAKTSESRQWSRKAARGLHLLVLVAY